jgi:chemotaxis receptor (MCP) glutamine deamidase CheD
MTETSVKIMQCALADSGTIKIDRVGVGVGILLYSQSKKIGIGIHTLAPQADSAAPSNPAKFADTAIPYAIGLFEKEGASPPFTVVIAGGATMAGAPSKNSVGMKLAEATKAALTKANVRIKADQTGGSNIRSMILNIDTGDIQVK